MRRAEAVFHGFEEGEPAVHLPAGIGGGVDAFGGHDLRDVRAPTIRLTMNPLEVFGREVKDVAVLMVTLGACSVLVGRTWTVIDGADEDMAEYVSEVSHVGIGLTALPVEALPTGSSASRWESDKDLSYPPSSA